MGDSECAAFVSCKVLQSAMKVNIQRVCRSLAMELSFARKNC